MFRACLGLTTTEAYEQWARQEKQEVFTDILPEDAKLHWFGPRRDGPEGRVLLFFYGASHLSLVLAHSLIGNQTAGGGFSLPPRPDYLPFIGALKKDISDVGNASVAMLEYCELVTQSPHCFTTFYPRTNDALAYSAHARVSFPNSTEAS
jgi:hypothetical protein